MSDCGCSISMSEAWTRFEETLYSRVLEATGGTDGRNAFLGYLPSKAYNAFYLKIGGGDADTVRNGCWSSMTIDAQVIGRFNERAKATDWVGMVLSGLSDGSFKKTGNLIDCMLQEMPDIVAVNVPISDDNDSPDALLFEATIDITAYVCTTQTFD